jgi:glutamate formiminotransferase
MISAPVVRVVIIATHESLRATVRFNRTVITMIVAPRRAVEATTVMMAAVAQINCVAHQYGWRSGALVAITAMPQS